MRQRKGDDAGRTVVVAPDLTRNGDVYTNAAYGVSAVTLNVQADAGIGNLPTL